MMQHHELTAHRSNLRILTSINEFTLISHWLSIISEGASND